MWPFGWKLHRGRGLRMWVVSLLSRSPKTGAEIMDAIEEMSQGWWRPSPGSLYPLLQEMEKEELIKKNQDGRYELSEKGKEEVGWPFASRWGRPQSVQDILNEMGGYVAYLEDLDKTDRERVEPFRKNIGELAGKLSVLAKGVS